jgi:hypothetical protein
MVILSVQGKAFVSESILTAKGAEVYAENAEKSSDER